MAPIYPNLPNRVPLNGTNLPIQKFFVPEAKARGKKDWEVNFLGL